MTTIDAFFAAHRPQPGGPEIIALTLDAEPLRNHIWSALRRLGFIWLTYKSAWEYNKYEGEAEAQAAAAFYGYAAHGPLVPGGRPIDYWALPYATEDAAEDALMFIKERLRISAVHWVEQ